MSRKLIATAAALLVLGTATAFTAIPDARAATPQTAATASTDTTASETPHRRMRGKHGARRNSPEFAIVRDLRALERLYLIDGRAQEIPTLYRDVLARTQNPAVREFAYHRIARNELKPGDADKAIATLRQSLDENLQRLAQQ